MVSIIAGLAYMKSKGFNHGEISPKTILLSANGKVLLMANKVISMN